MREILESFAENTEQRQWRLLIAVLEIGDPDLLADVEDDLHLERVVGVAPGALRQHARDVLQRRRKKARQRVARRLEVRRSESWARYDRARPWPMATDLKPSILQRDMRR